MAKDKGKKDKSGKSGKAGKEAREEGGVRLAKPLRKAGKEALKLAREPVVAEIVAAALLSAASALRGETGAKLADEGSKSAAKAGKASVKAGLKAAAEASKIGDSLRVLALDLARRTLDSWDRPDPESSRPAPRRKT